METTLWLIRRRWADLDEPYEIIVWAQTETEARRTAAYSVSAVWATEFLDKAKSDCLPAPTTGVVSIRQLSSASEGD